MTKPKPEWIWQRTLCPKIIRFLALLLLLVWDTCVGVLNTHLEWERWREREGRERGDITNAERGRERKRERERNREGDKREAIEASSEMGLESNVVWQAPSPSLSLSPSPSLSLPPPSPPSTRRARSANCVWLTHVWIHQQVSNTCSSSSSSRFEPQVVMCGGVFSRRCPKEEWLESRQHHLNKRGFPF